MDPAESDDELTIIMQVIFRQRQQGWHLDGTGVGLSCDPDGPFGR